MSTPRVEQMRSDSARKHPAWAAVREAFRVDWGPRTSVEKLLEDAGRALDEEQGALRRREPRLDQALGFGNTVTEREILQMYASTAYQEKGLCVILVLKLAVAMLEYGQNTVDAELMLLKVIHSLGLPHPHLNLGARSLQMSFGGGPVHLMNCKMDLLADKLLDISALCRHIAENKVDPADALCVLDGIIQRPLPFGWLVHFFNLECVCSWAALAAFFGTWQDMAAAAMITPFALLTRQFCMRKGLANLELLLCSLVVGIVTPLVWRYIVEVPLCHVPILWGSALLIYLPGCELIYGAYEIKYGSVINGAAQLMAALVRCMIMGVGLTIGWQVFGRDAAMAATDGKRGAIASMVPADACSFTGPSWQFVFGVLNFPMLFHCFLSLNMRLADLINGFCVAYPSLFAFMALVQMGTFPDYVTDAIGMFIAANLGSALERWNGTPICISIVPMVIILAPGWPSVRSVLGSMQKSVIPDEKVTDFWTDLALQGAAYAVGLSLALGMWRAWNHGHTQTRSQSGTNDAESDLSEESGSSDSRLSPC
mmetsp:Transcript_54127/g.155466  ORF Transcript_54127/g.155466 Transcript_54127/m.155466 type:complete len:540 (-) Transcript_54127:139-1758(-)